MKYFGIICDDKKFLKINDFNVKGFRRFFVSNIERPMGTEITPIKNEKNVCEFCHFSCSKNSDWLRHLATAKHKKACISDDNLHTTLSHTTLSHTTLSHTTLSKYSCPNCNKVYKSRNGLWIHKKKCNISENIIIQTTTTTTTTDDENSDENITLEVNENTIKTNIEVSYLSNLILEVVKNNTELQKQNQEFQQELQKQNQDFQMQMMEICKTSNVNINSNNNNKTFNLQVFLNEECKDAMNLSEFIESIHLKLPDLLNIGKLGYTEGISKIILKELNETAQNKRPVHCSDIKRETMYVKQENKWEKEGPDNLTIKNAIKNIEQKNIALLMDDWKAQHPNHMKSESSENDEYLRLVNQITSGSEDNLNKVVRRIAKEVMIKKTKPI